MFLRQVFGSSFLKEKKIPDHVCGIIATEYQRTGILKWRGLSERERERERVKEKKRKRERHLRNES